MNRFYAVLLLIVLVLCGCYQKRNSNTGNVVKREVGIWPISGNTGPDKLNDGYGPRLLGGAYDFHRGLDIKAPRGTPVKAVLAGTVVRSEFFAPGHALERFGNTVVIAHDPIEDISVHQTTYLHLDSRLVNKGDIVSQGDIIGTVGDGGVGINTVHLHFEHYVGNNDGLIVRKNTRNILRILPHEEVAPNITLTKQGPNLQLVITQHPGSISIVRVVLKPQGFTDIVLDYETREGMDPANDDTNPYNNIFQTPDDFNQSSTQYRNTIIFSGSYSGIPSAVLELTNVRGQVYRYEINL